MIRENKKKGINTMMAVLLFILLAFILVLFFYYGYNLIKNLLQRGFQ